VQRDVTRVGVFNATADGKFLHWSADPGILTELARQPEGRHLRAASRLEDAQEGLVGMSVDPSRGALLGLLVQRSTLGERLRHGGTIGFAIVVLGCVGLLLVGERLVHLMIVSRKIEEQRAADRPSADNPLGRILAVYEANPDVSVETLELKLDEAIQRESPGLERFLSTIRVLAVMAPLMGLLGTVTGMIFVFQDIQLFGSGDPKVMAGGISQALVTTVLGLLAAIPLLFCHSLLHGRAKGLVEILDEQSTGLVAARAERRPS
jgi:biopolymer transport protein ExbB